MPSLPIHDVLDEIKLTLAKHNRVVLQAPPGAGKTTTVPIALLEQPWLENKQIIMLEPRRLAARNAAARMAHLLNEKVGETIGYHIRQDKCLSSKTRILVVTEGILTRKLQADPELTNTALLIFDEFHERNLQGDLSLALSLQSQQILNEKLKILVMSATLNTNAIASLLDNAPVIQSEGRSYPVDIQYLDKQISTSNKPKSSQQQLLNHLASAIESVIVSHHGNCLVFLPGVKEINQLAKLTNEYLKTTSTDNIIIAPLHGSLSKQQQDQAINKPADNFRKIVLATNIAETSLTIEGIDCVIDSGMERVLQYNPSSAMDKLVTQSISQDSATQRAGRAGRLSAGTCYRMWTAQQHSRLSKHSIAEVLHSDLSSLVLELANWGVQQVNELQWMDRPPASAIAQAKSLLLQLEAIDDTAKITQHGQLMLKLGTHPRLAHMILKAIEVDQLYHACLIASILTEKDLFLSTSTRSYDIHDRLTILTRSKQQNQSDKLNGIDTQQCKRILQSADDFFKRCNNSSLAKVKHSTIDNSLSGVLLAYAYPDRIAQQRNINEPRYLLINGKGALIPEFLQHHLYEYLVIANLDARHGEATIYLAAEISVEQLENYLPQLIDDKLTTEWNEQQQRVEAKKKVSLGKLILEEKHSNTEDRQTIRQCLIKGIQQTGLLSLNWSAQASGLKQRIQFINYCLESLTELQNKSRIEDIANFSDEQLSATMSDWLMPFLTTENSIKQCQKLDLYNILLSQLSWEQQQLVDSLAPEKITVPSGSSIRIDYSDARQPVLAVRLQEVFGLYETPAIMNGQCQLMMHLLSPASRPMQVTQDLNSFWKTTYHDVKKELRGKYKRHYWPDDPFTAQATSKTKKNMHKS